MLFLKKLCLALITNDRHTLNEVEVGIDYIFKNLRNILHSQIFLKKISMASITVTAILL